MSSPNQMLAAVATAAAASAPGETQAPAAPATPAVEETPVQSPAVESAQTPANQVPEPPASSAQASAFSPRVALELTALAYPAMAATLTKLAIAADGGEPAFRAALLAERATGGDPSTTVSTAQTSTVVKPSGKSAADGRGAGLKAAAQAQNAK